MDFSPEVTATQLDNFRAWTHTRNTGSICFCPGHYYDAQYLRLFRVAQPMKRRYDQMFKLRQDGRISHATWEDYLRESGPVRKDIEDRMILFASTFPPYPAPPVMHSVKCATLVAWCTILPAIWIAFWILSHRMKANSLEQNLCAVCGYNLTGNTSGVCPECGRTMRRPSERFGFGPIVPVAGDSGAACHNDVAPDDSKWCNA